jgi:PAS domain S-box-containing protein
MNQWYGANVPLEGKKCFACYHNAERPCHPCPSLRCMQSGRPENEIVPGLPGSPVQWVELHAYPVVDKKSGAISGVVEFVRDITERVASQKALAESEEKYRLLVENATEAIFIAQDGYLKFVNPKTLQLIGHEGADVSQIPFVEFIHPDDRSMVAEMHRRRLAGDDHLPSAYTFRIMNKNGDKHPVELNTVKIDWDGRPASLNFVRDLSTQKRLEAELQQAQKMEAIGTLAGGIAHDFNNLLMGIMGRSSLMLTTLEPTDPHYEHVKGIEAYVKSATDLTGQLLGFARGGKYEVTPANMNDIVEQTACMFWRTKKEISIRTKYEPNLWTVEVDRRQMEQVLLNLFVNAWQAMSGGGELHLQTENLIVDAAHFRHQQVRPGPCVCISVTDTGVGMDEQTRRRIFEPFFTTKEMGRGTGLGLASAYGIIKNHAGAIKVYSEKGHGTTFAIYLPASENKVPAQKPRPQAILSGSGTVLLVDDEQLVIDVGHQMLAHLGYKVLVARSGAEAVRVYAQQKSNIDLVILDLIMPGGGGGETFDRLLAIDAHVKVLLSSGYSINGQAQDVLQRGCRGFIQKPFGLDQLSTTIRKILSED